MTLNSASVLVVTLRAQSDSLLRTPVSLCLQAQDVKSYDLFAKRLTTCLGLPLNPLRRTKLVRVFISKRCLHDRAQVPYILAQSTVFVPIAYWMIRFRATASAFFFFYFVFFLCVPVQTA